MTFLRILILLILWELTKQICLFLGDQISFLFLFLFLEKRIVRPCTIKRGACARAVLTKTSRPLSGYQHTGQNKRKKTFNESTPRNDKDKNIIRPPLGTGGSHDKSGSSPSSWHWILMPLDSCSMSAKCSHGLSKMRGGNVIYSQLER